MIKEILLVGLGSCVGGVLRYLVSLLMKTAGGGFPWGTFTVNILGCLLIGLLWGLGSKSLSPQLMLLLSVGLCGGFTTFAHQARGAHHSTFSRESLAMLQGVSQKLREKERGCYAHHPLHAVRWTLCPSTSLAASSSASAPCPLGL